MRNSQRHPDPYDHKSYEGYPDSYKHQYAHDSKSISVSQHASPLGAISQSAPEDKPLRVIHVGQYMFRAGIESWLKTLIRCSDPRRLQFLRCVVTSKIAEPSVIAEMGIPVEMGGADSVRRAAEDCDVLLCSGPLELGEWLGEIRPKLCLFVAHGESPWTREILEASAPAFDHVVAVSRRVKKLACNGQPTSVIYNGIDLTHLSRTRSRDEVRKSLGFGRDDFVVGYVGRFSVEKRAHTLIEAVKQLPPPFKVLNVGWGPLQQQLMDLANEQIPGRYAFAKGENHLGDYYQAMDAFCLPSEWEGFGLVLLEAMFSELPVVAGKIGFVPESLRNRVNCVMVNGKPNGLSEALLMLQQYPEWAQGLARQGKEYAEQNGHAARMAQQYAELIERLWLEKHGPSPATRSANSPWAGLLTR